MTRRTQSGFTLAEVLIALLIFAFIAAMSVYALRLGVNSRDQLSAADAELKRLQITRILLKEDLAQISQRPVRDKFGTPTPIPFAGGQVSFGGRVEDDEKILLSFVRGGWLNTNANAPRSALQHVEYIFTDDALIRRARHYLDETDNSELIERVLFDGLDDVEVQFLNGVIRDELDWVNAWPVGDGQSPSPRAVAITLYPTNAPPLRQLFWIGALGALR